MLILLVSAIYVVAVVLMCVCLLINSDIHIVIDCTFSSYRFSDGII